MTDRQLYLAIGAPMLFNALLIGLVPTLTSAFGDEVRQQLRALRWRAQFRKVEGLLNSRLKHREER